ncbi:MAG: ABC transporter substrate-binding protein [Ruminococcaceae bacterium]|nr:ABC transporter substrate-binding protein [Oscillospiraceae bacterium]
MKRYMSLALLLCLLLSGCEKTVTGAGGYTFTDDLGREVTVRQPKRVAALLGSFAQIWQLAGGEVVAAVDDAWEDLQLDLPEETVNLGGTENPGLERLLSARPDFVLASTKRRQNLEWQETLEAMDIAVAYFSVDDFDDYLRLLKICTDITGRCDLYEQHGSEVQAQIAAVREESRERLSRSGSPPSILCLAASASYVKAKNSEGNVLASIARDLGCINIADSETMLLEDLSMEHILVSDPDMIFIVQRGDDEEGMRRHVQRVLMDDPAWRELSAVKSGKLYFMDKMLFNLKPNHRWGEAYRILEEILREG